MLCDSWKTWITNVSPVRFILYLYWYFNVVYYTYIMYKYINFTTDCIIFVAAAFIGTRFFSKYNTTGHIITTRVPTTCLTYLMYIISNLNLIWIYNTVRCKPFWNIVTRVPLNESPCSKNYLVSLVTIFFFSPIYSYLYWSRQNKSIW